MKNPRSKENACWQKWSCGNRFYHLVVTGTSFKNVFTDIIVHVDGKEFTVGFNLTHSFLEENDEIIHSK